jgi:NAD(P)H-dependent flavin oxidoreductase YrpB (nitropropane dioxygenase family)
LESIIPILLAGMGGVAMHRLVGLVSNAGGLGAIGAMSPTRDLLSAEIRKTHEFTGPLLAVDLKFAPMLDLMRLHIKGHHRGDEGPPDFGPK